MGFSFFLSLPPEGELEGYSRHNLCEAAAIDDQPAEAPIAISA